jgi:hypothetical protein
MPHVVIANRLGDGIVVFLGTDGRWVERLADCPPAESPEDGEKLLDRGMQAERSQEVVDPMLIEVEDRDGVLTPVKRREAIRAMGPTVRPDLGKQAGN